MKSRPFGGLEQAGGGAEPHDHFELRGILLNWSKDSKLPSARVVGNHLNKFRGRVAGGKTLQFTNRKGMRAWLVKPVAPAPTYQPEVVSIVSVVSVPANLEDELSDTEKQELAEVLAEVKHSRKPGSAAQRPGAGDDPLIDRDQTCRAAWRETTETTETISSWRVGPTDS